MNVHSPLSGLYLLTPDLTDTPLLLQKVTAALNSGVKLLQYRNKTADTALRNTQANYLRALCHDYGATLMINDDPALALACKADGVHLGQSDMTITQARQLLGENAIIGMTCHDDVNLAQKAVAEGADYVSFGCFFPSSTKPHAIRSDLSVLTAAKQCLNVPIAAIGGINLDNAASVLSKGADMIAICAEVFASADTLGMIQKFQILIGK